MGDVLKDRLGVRGGAVESPHGFNIYVSDLREFLEGLHPRLCQLMGVVVPLVLYADDAALPADSAEDLQLMASLFEQFCNENRLFISTPKSFVTVFHASEDAAVVYTGDSVTVGGEPVLIKIYGQTISAAATFKYLGVYLDSCGSSAAHAGAKTVAFDRAAHLLHTGLSRIPSFPHSFLTYLWASLVKPVGNYGMELFPHSQSSIDAFRVRERKHWRLLLKVGGRSPNTSVQILMGEVHCDLSWRVARITLLLKLLNAPAGSWKHLAAIAHHHLQTPWFIAALADLRTVFPRVQLVTTLAGTVPFLSSTGSWTDEGDWASFHACSLPRNIDGLRFRPATSEENESLRRSVRAHIKRVASVLRTSLTRSMWSTVYEQVVSSSTESPTSKMALMALCLQSPGPPLHLALDQVALPSHRTAVASLLCGDWFLGK